MSYHETAIDRLGHIQQQMRDASEYIGQGQTFDLAIRRAQAFDEAADDVERNIEVGSQATLEIFLRNDDQIALLEGDDRGRTRVIVDRPHFAKHVALDQLGKDYLAAILVAHLNLEITRQHHENILCDIARMNDDRSPGDMAKTRVAGNFLQAFSAESFKGRQGSQGGNRNR